ncbi:MAG: cell division protein FtsL [Syntrophomonas sp.]
MLQAQYGYARALDTETAYEPFNRVKKVRRTVRKVDTRKSLIIKCSVCTFLVALSVVYLCIKSSTLGYQIVNLETDISKMETAQHQMEYQIAQKSSLQRIEAVATKELGMVKPENNSPFTVMVASKKETVKLAQQVKTTEEEKPLQKIYASLTHLAASNN